MPSVLIIGAGMAGLTAARELSRHGWVVTVLDKGRGVGGRMATRRIDRAKADHGTQYFSAKSPEFKAVVAELTADNIVTEWHLEEAHIADTEFDHSRYVGARGMNAIAKHLAQGLSVLTNQKVIKVAAEPANWRVETESGEQYRADKLLITIPAPQAQTLLAESGIDLDPADQKALADIVYQPCLAVVVLLNQAGNIPAPGAIRYKTGDIAWVADNRQKGISVEPTITIHASPNFSQAHFDDDLNAVGWQLVGQLSEYIPADALRSLQVHRWRYSLADKRYANPFLVAQTPLPLLFGGDGFGSGNLEGAFLSGLRMAQYCLQPVES